MSTTTQIIIIPSPEPSSLVERRTAYLQRRHRLSPAVAAVLAELAFAAAPTWQGRGA